VYGDIVCTNAVTPPVHSTLPGSGYSFMSAWPISSSASAVVLLLMKPMAASGYFRSTLMAKGQVRMLEESALPANEP
jgi:hypothetical protein